MVISTTNPAFGPESHCIMCLVKENLNIVHGSVRVIHVHRIGEVIPHIYLKTLIMDYINSKIIQVLELRNDAGNITNPVAAGVLDGSSITASFYHLYCSLL